MAVGDKPSQSASLTALPEGEPSKAHQPADAMESLKHTNGLRSNAQSVFMLYQPIEHEGYHRAGEVIEKIYGVVINEAAAFFHCSRLAAVALLFR